MLSEWNHSFTIETFAENRVFILFIYQELLDIDYHGNNTVLLDIVIVWYRSSWFGWLVHL